MYLNSGRTVLQNCILKITENGNENRNEKRNENANGNRNGTGLERAENGKERERSRTRTVEERYRNQKSTVLKISKNIIREKKIGDDALFLFFIFFIECQHFIFNSRVLDSKKI